MKLKYSIFKNKSKTQYPNKFSYGLITFMHPTDPQYHFNTTTSFTSAMPSITPTKLLKGNHLLILLGYLRNQCFFFKMKCNHSLKSLSNPGLILCGQIAINRSYTCYDIKMGNSINFKSVWGIWGLGFAVKDQKSLKRRN